MAGTDASEGQAVWQPGGAEEDSRLREGNRHLHLEYAKEEEELVHWCPTMTKSMFSVMRVHMTPQSEPGSTQVPTGVTTTVCCLD